MAWRSTWNEAPGQSRARKIWSRWAGGFTPPGVRLILIATIAVFVVDKVLLRGRLDEVGALSARDLMHLQVWRLLTFQFLHGNLGHIFWNLFLLWMLGVTLERQLGTKQFLYLYFLAGLVGGLFEVGFNVAMYEMYGGFIIKSALPQGGYVLRKISFLDTQAVGASAGVAGVLVAFAVRNPRAVFLLFFLIPVQAWLIAAFYCVIETRSMILGLSGQWGDNVAHAAHFGGMLMGFLWARYGYVIGSWRWPLGRPARRTPFGWRREPGPADQAEVDRILKKIHDEGIDSLSTREKIFLQDVSRRSHDGP